MCFRVDCLSILSLPTLCLKDPQIGNGTIHQEFLQTFGVVRWSRLPGCRPLKYKKNSPLTSNNHLLKRIDVTITYCCILICRFMQNTTTQWRRATQSFRKICTSHFIWKGCVWEGVEERTELQYIDPPLLWSSALCLSRSPGFLYRRPGGPAFCWLSLRHLVSNFWSPKNWLPVFTELYNSSIAHSISLEWHVWSSSSGNNCHAVHRSLSSGASVCECTVGF